MTDSGVMQSRLFQLRISAEARGFQLPPSTIGKTRRSPRRRQSGKRGAFRPVMVRASVAALSVRLPGGAELEVPRENLDAIRAVVAELVRSQSGLTAGDGLC